VKKSRSRNNKTRSTLVTIALSRKCENNGSRN